MVEEHKKKSPKQRQISTSVLLLLLWLGTMTSFGDFGSIYMNYMVLSDRELFFSFFKNLLKAFLLNSIQFCSDKHFQLRDLS